MQIRISGSRENFLLKCFVDEYDEKIRKYKERCFFIQLVDDHLFIVDNSGNPMKIKRYNPYYPSDKTLIEHKREIASKAGGRNYPGICIPLKETP